MFWIICLQQSVLKQVLSRNKKFEKIIEMGPCINSSESTQSMKNRKLQIGGYSLIVQQKLASGAYGDIWKCKDLKNNQILAVKQIKLQSLELKQMYNKQCKWLQKLARAPGIVRYKGTQIIDPNKSQNKKALKQAQIGVILTQFYEVSLFDMLKNKKFTAQEVLNFLKQMVASLKAIHDTGCIHMDLKLQNILCQNDQNGVQNYYICDFGSCVNCPTNISGMSKAEKSRLKQYIESNSTLIYRPPELIQLNQNLTGKIDVWMLGCILYMLLYRKHPFEGQGQLGIMTGHIQCQNNVLLVANNTNNQKLINSLISCVKGMIEVKVDKRFSEEQILKTLSA